MSIQQIPQTPRARLYCKILGVVWVMSISAMTLIVSSIASDLLDVGFHPMRLDARAATVNVLQLLGVALMWWMSARGSRRNLMPPQWAMLATVIVMWAALLVNRYA